MSNEDKVTNTPDVEEQELLAEQPESNELSIDDYFDQAMESIDTTNDLGDGDDMTDDLEVVESALPSAEDIEKATAAITTPTEPDDDLDEELNEELDVVDLSDEDETVIEVEDTTLTEEERAEQERRRKIARGRRQALRRAQRRSRSRKVRDFFVGWSAIKQAQQSGQFVYVKINGVITESTKGTMAENLDREIFAIGKTENNMPVMIAFSELFLGEPINMDSVDLSTPEGRTIYLSRKRAMTEKTYNMVVPVLITYMQEGTFDENENPRNFYIAGSRVQALKQQQQRNYGLDENGNRRYDVGRFVRATIIAVSGRSIRVTAGGADSSIPLGRLTYRYIAGESVMNELYKVGDRIRVQITDVKQLEDGTYDVMFDARPFELIEAAERRYSSSLKHGAHCLATVTQVLYPRNVNDTCDIQLYIESEKMPAMARSVNLSDYAVRPNVGDVMRVIVRGFGDNGMTYVSILQFHGPIPTR